MPFRHLHPTAADLAADLEIQRAFVLCEDLATEIAEVCRAIGDEPGDFVADALILAVDEARATLELEEASG